MINPFENLENKLDNIYNIIQQMGEQSKSQARNINSWMDIDSLCAYHPNHPSKKTVYAWTYQGKIPHYKDPGGKGVRFLTSEIDEWLKTGRVATKKETSDNPAQFLKKRKK
jgi:excisionase family DNA binding protein